MQDLVALEKYPVYREVLIQKDCTIDKHNRLYIPSLIVTMIDWCNGFLDIRVTNVLVYWDIAHDVQTKCN